MWDLIAGRPRISDVRRAGAVALVLAAAAAAATVARADGGGRATGLATAAGNVWTTVPGGILPLDPRTGRIVGPATATGRLAELTSGGDQLWGLRPWTLVRIDLRRHAVSEFHIHGPAYAFAAGFGSVWVANIRDGTLSRIDVRSGRTVATIRGIGREAESVAVGFGSVWISSVGPWRKGPGGVMVPVGRGAVTRVDPGRNAIVRRIRVGRGAAAVVTGESSVWVANSRGVRPDDTVSRIDPRTNRVTATIVVPRGAAGVAAGAGSGWVVESPSGGGGNLTRIDAATDLTRTTRLRPSWIPGAVLVSGGRIWVADEGTATVLRIDPRTLQRTVARIGIPSLPPPRIEAPALERSDGGVDWRPLAAIGGLLFAGLIAGAALVTRRIRAA